MRNHYLCTSVHYVGPGRNGAARVRRLTADTIRGLAMDAVQKANSRRPGMPMGIADAAVVLWTRFLKHNPADPLWPDRDRFILSTGHGSMLLYSLLHLSGYNLPLGQLQALRQWGSRTPLSYAEIRSEQKPVLEITC